MIEIWAGDATADSAAGSAFPTDGSSSPAAPHIRGLGRRPRRGSRTVSADARRAAPVTVYTRPGCPYCFLLRRGLRRRGVSFVEVDIWQDPQAAAAVRAVADGNETVPTVNVAGQWLVNPRAAVVARLAESGSGPQ